MAARNLDTMRKQNEGREILAVLSFLILMMKISLSFMRLLPSPTHDGA